MNASISNLTRKLERQRHCSPNPTWATPSTTSLTSPMLQWSQRSVALKVCDDIKRRWNIAIASLSRMNKLTRKIGQKKSKLKFQLELFLWSASTNRNLVYHQSRARMTWSTNWNLQQGMTPFPLVIHPKCWLIRPVAVSLPVLIRENLRPLISS